MTGYWSVERLHIDVDVDLLTEPPGEGRIYMSQQLAPSDRATANTWRLGAGCGRQSENVKYLFCISVVMIEN